MIEPKEILNITETSGQKYQRNFLKNQTSNENKYFKRKWKIPQVLSKLEANKISNSQETNSKNHQNKTSRIKKEFLEWSLLTKFDCYSKIYEYEVVWMKFFWLILFLTFTGLTAWLVIFNVINFCHYEVTSIIEIKNERPTNFPVLTACNNNPFTSKQSQSLNDYISRTTFNLSFENMTFEQAYDNSGLINELTKMFVNAPSNNDSNRGILTAFGIVPALCFFNSKSCLENINDYFRSYFSYDYGNCYQFNTGYNYTNSPIPLLKQSREGSQFGLSLIVGPIVNQNEFLSSFSDGMVIFIHNQSYPPSASSAIRIEMGKETNIAVERTFTTNQPSPYTECQDLSSFQSELYNLVLKSNYSYRQTDCFDLCLQREIINACECYWTKYTRMYDAEPCLNVTQFECIYYISNDFEQEKCSSECPLECNSVTYHYSLSSLSFPSQSFYNKFYSDPIYINVTMKYGINISTLESFQKYYLMLNVFYPYLEYTQITETAKFTWIDLLSQIGGSLGMFLGFSIFHLIEIVEILWIFFCILLKKIN